jgi:hypothetical protein
VAAFGRAEYIGVLLALGVSGDTARAAKLELAPMGFRV